MDAAVVQGLRERGHVLESIADPYMDFGSGQFIWRMSDDFGRWLCGSERQPS